MELVHRGQESGCGGHGWVYVDSVKNEERLGQIWVRVEVLLLSVVRANDV